MGNFSRSMKEFLSFPSAVFGLIIVIILAVVAVYTVIAIPYEEVARLWRGGENVWYMNPKNAQPVWVNWFRQEDLPETISLDSRSDPVERSETAVSADMRSVRLTYSFDYPYSTFPDELIVFFKPQYQSKSPYASLTWITPDGREFDLGDEIIQVGRAMYISQDTHLRHLLGDEAPEIGLFLDPNSNGDRALPGTYQLVIDGFIFAPDDRLDAEMVVYGQVWGWAGTDHLRRNLGLALLWGTPVALSFGLVAAIGVSFATMIISAFGTWYGGWIDELIQRFNEVNMVLPMLPIVIMIATLYSRNIWTILGVIILLSIFGGGIMSYRAIFLQVKESPYIEAARTYGAGNWRIIMKYMLPRIIPMIVPDLVVSVPSFVFLDASLAVLGLADPFLPTWGKVIEDAQTNGALFRGQYYWVLEPSFLLILTGFAFAMIGFALDRVFNPRLRQS